MRTRLGFVSNSSSSSFILQKDGLSELHRLMVLNHIECGKMFESFSKQIMDEDNKISRFCIDCYDGDEWFIEETEKEIKGSTIVDNFKMDEYFFILGIDEKLYQFEYD